MILTLSMRRFPLLAVFGLLPLASGCRPDAPKPAADDKATTTAPAEDVPEYRLPSVQAERPTVDSTARATRLVNDGPQEQPPTIAERQKPEPFIPNQSSPPDPILPPAPSSTEKTPPPDVIEIDVAPVRISSADPAYPSELQRKGIEGRVIARAWIGEDGVVHDVQILRSDHPMFNESTIDALRSWRFRPALKQGQPVAIWLTIPVRFRLR
ncbi:MAG: TonB family protein [Bacteroidetes bacterium]|nr:TonB family protein [Bacteroidota bacterium]